MKVADLVELLNMKCSFQHIGQQGAMVAMRALRAAGFVHGPQRQLPSLLLTAGGSQADLRAAFHHVTRTVVVLHTRHPLEAMISHYFCVSNHSVCPRRHALLRAANRSTHSSDPTTLHAASSAGASSGSLIDAGIDAGIERVPAAPIEHLPVSGDLAEAWGYIARTSEAWERVRFRESGGAPRDTVPVAVAVPVAPRDVQVAVPRGDLIGAAPDAGQALIGPRNFRC